MKIKVSETTPVQLNFMVAKATGMIVTNHNGGVFWGNFATVTPATSWAQSGPIIEANNIQTWKDDCSNDWLASPFGVTSMDTAGVYHSGPTLLIAAMKCYVASQLGEEVEVPDELA